GLRGRRVGRDSMDRGGGRGRRVGAASSNGSPAGPRGVGSGPPREPAGIAIGRPPRERGYPPNDPASRGFLDRPAMHSMASLLPARAAGSKLEKARRTNTL